MKTLTRLMATALLIVPGAAMADVTVGVGTSGNCFPFGCSTGDHYQQVYTSGAFGSALTITGLKFKAFIDGTPSSGTFDVSLSTTSAAVNGLSSTFADNLGGDNALKFSGTLGPNYDGTYLTLTFSSGFSYDPSGGNLLVDIVSSGQSGGSIYFDALNGDAGGLFSRMHNYGSAFENWGLVTTFVTEDFHPPVPEPATWAMMIGGFALAGAALRRRKGTVSYA